MHVVTGRNLAGNGPGDFLTAMSDVDDQRPTRSVYEAPAFGIRNPDAAGLDRLGKGFGQLPMKYSTWDGGHLTSLDLECCR